MVTSVADVARQLDLLGLKPVNGGTYNELHQSLAFFRVSHYDQYVPTLGSEYPDFEARLLDWLNNVVDDADKGLLLELAHRIVFFTREDFAKLYTAALRGPIYQWIIEELALSFTDPNLETLIRLELEDHTWFTSITDSMPISDFHHANRLGGIDHRPDWRSLAQFGDPVKIHDYINSRTKPIKRVVILEDFVGTGTQMVMNKGSVSFAVNNVSIPVLLSPLIVCPQGATLSRQLAAGATNLTFSPILEITQDELVSPHTILTAGSLEGVIRDTCARLYGLVEGDRSSAPLPYSPWGFGETGALIVMYSNTPANTLPVIQHGSNTWRPLFPRSARLR